MDITFTNVFYENTFDEAERRLTTLRRKDKYPEIKAYIILTDDGMWRVLRRIRISSSQKIKQSEPQKVVLKCKQIKTRKAGL